MSFRADGNAAHAPPPAQLLGVLSSVRSDYLEAVHLLRASLSPFLSWEPELGGGPLFFNYSASGPLTVAS